VNSIEGLFRAGAELRQEEIETFKASHEKCKTITVERGRVVVMFMSLIEYWARRYEIVCTNKKCKEKNKSLVVVDYSNVEPIKY